MTTRRNPSQPGPVHGAGAWWRGQRGEWLVVVQVVLMALVAIGPRSIGGWPPWPFPVPQVAGVLGAALVLIGGAVFLASLVRLGPSLTALPYPRPDGSLVVRGPYAFVRHPIYAGGIALSVGWALVVQGWLTLAYAAVLFVFLDLKARREERWLVERYPGYGDYQRRVRKLVPFVY
jgi:protein-S-isoprenylcysteine O-methyltransferase Ste14